MLKPSRCFLSPAQPASVFPRSAGRSACAFSRSSAFAALVFLAVVLVLRTLPVGAAGQLPELPPARIFDNPQSVDEDEMAVWVHPTDPALSTIIVADKFAGLVFVYGLDGTLLQAVPSPSPRNIDVRYGIQFDGGCVDVVAFNERLEEVIRIYAIDPDSRLLERIDDGAIVTARNYGFTLYHREDGRLFAITGPRVANSLLQFELFDDGAGHITGATTGWEFPKDDIIEGMVADDETGYLYLAEEKLGIWKVAARDSSDRSLIATVGDASGLAADVEGVTLYYAADGEGYIIASSQGPSQYTVLEREPPHAPAGGFELVDVHRTDGIDVVNLGLDATFDQGIFLAHDGGNCCSVSATRWQDIASALGLRVDTAYWDPRRSCVPLSDAVTFVEVAAGAATDSASLVTDSAVAGVAGDLYLAAISGKPYALAQSVSGLGLDWQLIGSQCSARSQTGVQVWAALGAPASDGTVAVVLPEVASSAALAVNHYSGTPSVNPIAASLSANSNGEQGSCSDGEDDADYAHAIDSTGGGALVYQAVAMRNRLHTPGLRYRQRVEIATGTGGAITGLTTSDRVVTAPGPVPVDGSFSSAVDWALVAFEIVAAAPGTTTTTTTTVPEPALPGDVNGDGRVTATDALFALAAAVGVGSCPLCSCDVDDSGAITATDALLILRLAVGMPVVARPPPC